MQENVLEMKKINKAFSGVPVLCDVDFALKRGSIHALIGQNGAGKSTLMKIMTGVYTKDSGELYVQGKPVSFSGYRDANKCGIRMIFQEMSSVPTLTVTENIFLNAELKKGIFLDKAAMHTKALQVLKQLNMESIDPDSKVGRLTTGECQLVEIAKAIANDAKILIMDEPTSTISDSEVETLFGIIRNLKNLGVSIVYISHKLKEILRISDEVTILRDGKRVVTKDVSQLDMNSMIAYMLGESKETAFAHRPTNYQGTTNKLFEVKHLHVNHMVTDINLHVDSGEVLGIAGLMGSGRTEILESVFGIMRPIAGEIYMNGKKLRIKHMEDSIEAGIGLIPEDRRRKGLIMKHSLEKNEALTVFDKICIGPFLKKTELDALANKSIRDLDIKTDSVNKIVGQLSGGNQQKVVIAKWLLSNLKLLLLDEPTAGVDIGSKSELIDIVRAFADAGNGAIFVSSEIPELLAICDRIIVLRRGKIITEFLRTEITEEVLQNAIQL